MSSQSQPGHVGRRARIGALVGAVVAETLVGVALGTSRAAAAATCPTPQQPSPVAVSARTAASARPVVLVHGWNSDSAGMANNVAPALDQRLHSGFRFYAFNYGKDADAWAASAEVAGCLADYIGRIAAAHSAAGGDGKVLVVGHSMGGLAARFAAGPTYAQYGAAAHLGGLITMDTPHLGSPWGGTDLTRLVAQVLASAKDVFGDMSALPPPGTDAAFCLKSFTLEQPLPKACASAPPLPKGVLLTELAGRLTVHRTMFGFSLYDIDLGGDGIVDIGSEEGYTASIAKQDRSPTNMVSLPTAACTVPLDQIIYRGNATAVLGEIGAATFLDNAALDTLSSGKYGTSLAWFVLGALKDGSCSHVGITKSPMALDEVASALKAQDAALQARRPVQAKDLLTAPVPELCEHKAGQLVDGKLPGLVNDGNGSPGYEELDTGGPGSFEKSLPPVLADLTGDGVGDAAAVMHCSAGGVSWPDTVLFYGPGTKLLGAFDMSDPYPAEHANVLTIAAEGRGVRVTWRTTEGCCFSPTEWTALLRWDGAKIVAFDARMTAQGPPGR